MSITSETRREGHESVLGKKTYRRNLILDILGDRQMTVSEIVKALLDSGIINYYDRNFVAPRLTELADAGKVKVVGKRTCIMSGKNVAVYARVEEDK